MPPPEGPPPQALALEMALGHWRTMALVSFISSGLADLMNANDFMEPESLAKEAGLDADAVFRLLRYLASVQVCIEDESGGTFKLGPIGEVVQTNHPATVAGSVLLEGSALHCNLWRNLPEFLKTGERVVKSASGCEDYWAYCKETPEHLKVFQRAMTCYSNDEAMMMKLDFLSPTMDLSSFKVVCDLGGAEGACAKALSARFPDATYILSDLQEAIDNVDQSTLPSNFKLEACDFFKADTIPSADAYLLKHIIHDWDDAKSIQILENIKSANPDATVFVMEFGPMPGPNQPHLSKIFDLHMGIAVQGHERTQEEYNTLFEKAGWSLSRTHSLAGGGHPMYVQEIAASK